VDEFELLSEIGRGGMGVVYRSRNTTTSQVVALKLLRSELLDQPQAQHRFEREARHMAQLQHPNILAVLTVGARNDTPYFTMPFMERGSLRRALNPDTPLPKEEVLRIAGDVAAALQYAHSKGITHRDLKPDNVLLDAGGRAFLTDFGLAKTLFNDSLTDVNQQRQEGTAAYMSPQLARGEAEDTRCDIYAFGALLYEMLAGQPPYEGASDAAILEQIKRGAPRPILEMSPAAPKDLVTVSERAMAREHRERYASMADVVADLELVKSGQSPRMLPEPSAPTIGSSARLGWVAAGTIGALALLLGLIWLNQPARHQETASPQGARTEQPQNPSVPSEPRLVVKASFPTSGITDLANGVLADWDQDGKAELLLIHENLLKIFSYTGQIFRDLKAIPEDVSFPVIHRVDDLDGDGFPEALISYSIDTNAFMVGINRVGWEIRKFRSTGNVSTNSKAIRQPPGFGPTQLADLDGDGNAELITSLVTTWAESSRAVQCFDVTTEVKKWSYDIAGTVANILIMDLNGDGVKEVLVGTYSPDNGIALPNGTDDRHCYLYALSHQGELLWYKEVCDEFGNAEFLPALQQGRQTTRLMAWAKTSSQFHQPTNAPETGKVFAFDVGGNLITNYDAGVELWDCLAADLDQDGTPEILCTDREGFVHVLNADLSLRFKRQVVTNRFDRAEVNFASFTKLRPGLPPQLVVYSSLRRFDSPQYPGNDLSKPNLYSHHDNYVLVLDAQLNIVDKYVVADEWTESPGLRVEVWPGGEDGIANIWVLGAKAEMLLFEHPKNF